MMPLIIISDNKTGLFKLYDIGQNLRKRVNIMIHRSMSMDDLSTSMNGFYVIYD